MSLLFLFNGIDLFDIRTKPLHFPYGYLTIYIVSEGFFPSLKQNIPKHALGSK